MINASAAGVFIEALKHSDVIEKVYGAANGIVGILNEKFYDIGQEDPEELEMLKYTPSSSLGSCRYKLADVNKDDTDYQRLLEVFPNTTSVIFFITEETIQWTHAIRYPNFSRNPVTNAA